jgi:replicative DNA helicase Mcm
MASILDNLKWLIPLSKKNAIAVDRLKEYLGERELESIRKGVKQGKLRIGEAGFGITIAEDTRFHVLEIRRHDEQTVQLAEQLNKRIEEKAREKIYDEISASADAIITKLIAPKIVGFETIKQAVTIQLFSDEQVNILLIGDPGTGKTEILRSISEIAPVSSFGLGSGLSGVGLTVTVKGSEIQKGILSLADKGIACIDELNLIKKEDVGSLYNAMEKGFVTYDKGGKHYRFDARASVLATANPRYTQFLGKTTEQLRKELPFDSALLTRFHLVFFIRKPDIKKFVEITKGILGIKDHGLSEHDRKLIKNYICHAKKIAVTMPKQLEERIIVFAKGLKEDEKKFLVEVNPRLVVGIVRLAKASARSELRDTVQEKDLQKVFSLIKQSLYSAAR